MVIDIDSFVTRLTRIARRMPRKTIASYFGVPKPTLLNWIHRRNKPNEFTVRALTPGLERLEKRVPTRKNANSKRNHG
jgi:hypothetical protein